MLRLIFKAVFSLFVCCEKSASEMALQPKAGERQQEIEMQEFSFVFLCMSVGSPSICLDSVSPKSVPEAFTVCCCSRAAGIQGFIFIRFDHSLFMRQHSLC